MKKYFLLLIFGIGALGYSCNAPVKELTPEKLEEAQALANDLFELIENKKVEESYELYSAEFWNFANRNQVLEIYKRKWNILGPLQEVKFVRGKLETKDGLESFTLYLLEYNNRYENYEAVESIRFYDKNGKLSIAAYDIKSEGFFQVNAQETNQEDTVMVDSLNVE